MAVDVTMDPRELALGGCDEDARLVERCRRGEPGAAEHLVREHTSAVYGVGVRLLGDREEARDLAQEVFLRAFRGLQDFRGGASLRTWLLRIAVNQARNRRRSFARRRRLMSVPFEGAAGGDPWTSIADPRPGPDDALRARTVRERLAEALAGLPEPFREAVVLRDVQGLDYHEIGRVLALRRGTVKSRIARGREMLRRQLEDLL